MMKRSLTVATFLVASGGAVAVGAGSAAGLKGSDTLFDITTQMFKSCPGIAATSLYAGGGSGTGQSAVVAGTQTVAPMSRFFNNGASICTKGPDGGVAVTTAEGLVIGLDGVQIVGSKRTLETIADDGGTTNTCSQTTNANCATNPVPLPGSAAIDTTVNGYTFNGWRDVLRVLLAGFDHTNTGTNAAAWAARDCNSATRIFLANNYGAFFENNCTPQAGDTTGNCVAIRHIFRRDDFSGTSDTMVSLLGLPSIVNPETTSAVSGGPAITNNHTGATPFCHAVRPYFVFPSASVPTCLQGVDATYDPTSKNTTATCAGQLAAGPANATTRETVVYRATFQDNDPIRRTCVGSGTSATAAAEDACSHSGDLGLVLPIPDVPEETLNPARTNADRYNATACTRKFVSVQAPDAYDAMLTNQKKAVCTQGLLCPNGDVCNNLGGCLAPATAAGNVQCLANKLTAPLTTISTVGVPVVHPVGPGIAEGRAYTQHLYVQNGTAGQYQADGFSTPLLMTGAFYRIHAVHSLSPVTPNPRTCQLPDMTDQIGCLVEASPCSLGYAGRGSTANSDQNGNVNTEAININNQSPITQCIQGNKASGIAGFTYPLSRKLYLNSLIGFNNVTGEELQLAGCETDLAQSTASFVPATPGGLLTTNAASDVDQFGFIHIAADVNGGEPYCEDFNETVLCGSATFPTNGNACEGPHTNFTTFPAGAGVDTICGNGTKEAYEDCDPGAANLGLADPTECTGGTTVCSTTCRCL